jgi:nucleoporin NUP159
MPSTQKPQAIPQDIQQQAEAQRRAANKARKDAEDTRGLEDKDDDQMQKFLASDLVATQTLDEFVAHADYVGDRSMESIPAQVETVYRDINSMIDTLGVNAR